MYCRFSNDKVIFQTFWSVNAFSYEFCCESELPNNLVDLAEAAFQQRYSKWNCWVLLSARKHFANILVFTRLWRFLNTHLNVYLMTPVSVFSFTLKFLYLQSNTEQCFAALPSDRLTGKVLKLVLSANKDKPPPTPQKTEQGVGKSKHINTLCIAWGWRKRGESAECERNRFRHGSGTQCGEEQCRVWGCTPSTAILHLAKNKESLQASAATDSAPRGWNLYWT